MPASVTVTSSGKKSYKTTYTHDKQGRLAGMIDPDGGVWAYAHDKADRLTKIQRPNGVTSTYTYGTQLARPTLIEDRDKKGKLLSSRALTYDKAERVASLTGPGGKRSYAYDKLGRLASEAGASSTAWSHDRVGNLTKAGGDTLSYDKDDRLLTRSGAGGTTTYTHDGRGNRTGETGAGGTRVYTYDALDRLVGATSGGAKVKYAYDAKGLLVQRTFGVKMERCLTALSNSAGAKVAAFDYDAWGRPRGAAPAETFTYGYAGAYTDSASGLIYLRARWYDPRTGRFISADRADAIQEDPRSIHRYAYTTSDPLNKIDPMGTMTIIELNSATSIRATLQAMKTAVIQCLKKKGIKTIVWSVAKYMVKQILVKPALSAVTANLSEWLKLGDDAFELAIGKLFCFNMGSSGTGLGMDVEQHVAINDCGKRLALKGTGKDCKNLVIQTFGSTSTVDLLLKKILPVEVKNGRKVFKKKEKQLKRFCRAASNWGSHVLLAITRHFPNKAAMSGWAVKCFTCWSDAPAWCDKKPIGSLAIFIGFKKGSLKIGIPDPKTLSCK